MDERVKRVPCHLPLVFRLPSTLLGLTALKAGVY